MATPLSVPTMPKESTKTSKVCTICAYSRIYLQPCNTSCLPSVTINALQKRAAASEKKTKKGKDGPKRPLSAYMFFSQDWRERIKTENPDAGFGAS